VQSYAHQTESLDAFAIEASVARHFRRMRMTLGRVTR
jgi:hypothetical protein